jgi:hypothetical protein
MTAFLIVWLRKYDKTQDFDGDEENSFSQNQPDKVFFSQIFCSVGTRPRAGLFLKAQPGLQKSPGQPSGFFKNIIFDFN